MNKTQDQEQPKKCYCARCFLPIDPEDKVDIEGQNFHRQCCTCCICRTIPKSLKMFYGHVFCNDCFKQYVLNKFKGDAPRMYSNSWWMQWGPNVKAQDSKEEKDEKNENEKNENEKKENKKAEKTDSENEKTQIPTTEECPKKCICARCLQAVDENDKIDIGGQSFHCQCARCYFCHCVPKDNVKIYYGQVFCEECFHRHVLNRSKDNPSEFFKNCFEQWQNPQVAEQMRDFMTGGNTCPFLFMMQGPQPPFCRCGTGPQQEWFQKNEPRKSALPTSRAFDDESFATCDLSYENRTEESDQDSCCESANPGNYFVAAAEKIVKLTKYLNENECEKFAKKWKNFIVSDKSSMARVPMVVEPGSSCCSWFDLQDRRVKTKEVDCPKCLWQCGPIFVNCKYFGKECCGDTYSFE